jgi:hypothetical protein
VATSFVGIKLTEAETDVLDWLVSRLDLLSRSDALRMGMAHLAQQQGIQGQAIEDVIDSRRKVQPRRRRRDQAGQFNRPANGRTR